jgi:hypothetical protein
VCIQGWNRGEIVTIESKQEEGKSGEFGRGERKKGIDKEGKERE